MMSAFSPFVACVSIVGFLSSAIPASADVYTPIDSTYKLTFDEEFNGTTVDSTKWGKNWLGNPTDITKPINSGEIAGYAPRQVSVANGYLRLTALQEVVRATNGKTYNFVSGIVQSHRKFQQAFGYIEARVYFPGSYGKISNFPAFWMNGDHPAYGKEWPYAGELDIVEGLGGGVARYHFHSLLTHAGGGPDGAFTGWHVYGALWKPGSVTFYYDGVKVGQLTTGITSLPMYLILNNGISDEHGGPRQIPASMLVDYVHVYSKDSSAVAVTPQPGYGGPGDTGDGKPVPEMVPPSVPVGLIGVAASASQINLTWSTSKDNVGVRGYRVKRNGVYIGSVTTPRLSVTGLTGKTRYTFAVAAFDAAGNVSAYSAPRDVVTLK